VSLPVQSSARPNDGAIAIANTEITQSKRYLILPL
jgi:hypothetical protein